MNELVRIERAANIATVILDRPPVNAIILPLLERAAEVLAVIARDVDVGAVVLTGARSRMTVAMLAARSMRTSSFIDRDRKSVV